MTKAHVEKELASLPGKGGRNPERKKSDTEQLSSQTRIRFNEDQLKALCILIGAVTSHPLLSNSCKTRRNTAKDEQKYQPIFLLVFSGSRVTKSQVY